MERHLLVSSFSAEPAVGHAIASTVLDERELLGGSGYFAALALSRLGLEVHLATNTGSSNALRRRLRAALPTVRIHDERLHQASRYLSLWDGRGKKRLYVQSASDAVLALADAVNNSPEARILALSLRDLSSYDQIADLGEQGRSVFAAPNQTLLGATAELGRLAAASVVTFMNDVEARALAQATSVTSLTAWLDGLERPGALVITHGGGSLTVLRAGRPTAEIKLDQRSTHPFALGGGDQFAALASAHWTEDLSDFGLSAAHTVTSASLEAERLFDPLAWGIDG